jgi:putative glutamine amidotransferase
MKECFLMRPLIGIPLRAGVRGELKRPVYYSNQSYIHAVEQAGGIPILLPIMEEMANLHTVLPRLDGLLLSGGQDIHPGNYDEDVLDVVDDIDPQLDEMEFTLARWAWHEDVPTLGICRGMQLLNVALGGSLYQDLATQYAAEKQLQHANWKLPRNQIAHMVSVMPASRMEQVLGTHKVSVNSLHHQAIKKPGKGVVVSGWAEDGVAELIEVAERTFMLGTQCHPEELYRKHPEWLNLFSAFVEASAEHMRHPLDTVTISSLPTTA